MKAQMSLADQWHSWLMDWVSDSVLVDGGTHLVLDVETFVVINLVGSARVQGGMLDVVKGGFALGCEIFGTEATKTCLEIDHWECATDVWNHVVSGGEDRLVKYFKLVLMGWARVLGDYVEMPGDTEYIHQILKRLEVVD